ncbi:MAG TPA: EamA family transporter [Burkholderiaceae bacterium]|nr:EamA family transporter [Burkholderiaceae bacterium]
MSSTAFALIVVAALLHAGWNLWMKRSGTAGGFAFVWATNLVGALLFTPLVWLAGAFETGGSAGGAGVVGPAVAAGALPAAGVRFADWPLSVWLAVVGSVLLHTAYFRVLQRGYGAGDLSIVYPVARGTGPLLASIAAIAWLGEPAGLHSIAGLAFVVAGTFTIAGGLAMLREGASTQTRRGLSWGLATGLLIAAYTVNDGRAVSVLGANPLVYYWWICLLQAVVLAPWVMWTVPGWRRVLSASWRVVLGVGVLSPLSYLLALEAMRLAPVSVVAPARELSMLVAALAGATLLREGQLGRRLAGSALIAGGVALLAAAG